MKKLLVLLLVLFPVLLLIFANVVYSAPPADLGALPSFPVMTLAPFPSFLPLDFVVDIPDPALKAALHAKTGVPAAEAIYQSDLKALTGSLFLDNLGIANAEGLQYCKNIETLSLEDNSLTTLPNMSGMTSLKWLKLRDNNLNILPNGLFGVPHLERLELRDNPVAGVDMGINAMTALKELNLQGTDLDSFPIAVLDTNIEKLTLSGAPIGSIPFDINLMTHLKELYVSRTKLESLPGTLFGMTNLEILEAGGNKIESIPSSISGMTNLKQLSLSSNKLGSLPDSICSLTNLQHLDVSYNGLYDLPGNIGNHLFTLTARGNKLTSLPGSVIHSSTMYVLDVSKNRFVSLPSDFDEMSPEFDPINIEFNFLDVSPGSPARELIDDNPAFEIYYKRQLTPVKDLTAAPSSDSVTLAWSLCPDGSDDDATWEVDGYAVYEYKNGEMVKISDLGKSETSFTHTGLTPETAYDYRVGVDYHVVDNARNDDIVTRCYTKIEATTLAYGAAETIPPVSPAVSAAVSPEASPDTLPAAEETNAATPAGESGFPVWAIIIAAIGALGIVGTGAAIVILKIKRSKA